MEKCSVVLLVFGLATSVAPCAGEQAHVHGAVTLNVAIETNSVSLQMEAPLDSLVGFEHAPRNSAQEQAVQAMFERFKAPQKLFGFDTAAQCALKASSAESEALKADAGKKASKDDDHADLDASIEFDCKQPSVVRSIDLSGLLAAFPRIHRVDAQITSPAGQFKQSLKRPEKILRWGR